MNGMVKLNHFRAIMYLIIHFENEIIIINSRSYSIFVSESENALMWSTFYLSDLISILKKKNAKDVVQTHFDKLAILQNQV